MGRQTDRQGEREKEKGRESHPGIQKWKARLNHTGDKKSLPLDRKHNTLESESWFCALLRHLQLFCPKQVTATILRSISLSVVGDTTAPCPACDVEIFEQVTVLQNDNQQCKRSILSRWRGQRTSWLYCVKNTCRKSLLVQEPKIPETALFQQKLYTQGPLQPSPALRFPRSRRAGRHQSETHASLSALRGSGQRSSKHLGERMELAVWDVPAVPTLQRPVEGLEK